MKTDLVLNLCVKQNLPADGPASDGTCDFEEELFTVAVDAGSACDFAVTIGIDFASAPKFGSNKPNGFVHLAAWKTGDKENTLQCLYSKGYHNDSEDIGGGLIKLSFDGHALFFGNEDVSIGEGIDSVSTPGMYWMSGGTMEWTALEENCTYDEQTTEWACDLPVTIIKAKGAFVDLCAAMSER